MKKREIQIVKKTLGDFELNSYIIYSVHSGNAIIVDAGENLHIFAKKFLKEKELTLKAILITHCHIDHIQGLSDLQTLFKVETYANKLDEYLVSRFSEQARMFQIKDPGTPQFDKFVSGGEVLEFGDIEVKVLHTSGHTKGHLTYVIDGDAFVGDCIFAGSIGRTDFPGSNYEELINSIRNKIFPLGDDTVLHPGHGPDTTVKEERLHNPFVGDKLFG